MSQSVTIGGSSEVACSSRGADHHGGSKRKSLHHHLWGDRKWKDHSSASVSVWSWLCQVGYPLYGNVPKASTGHLTRRICDILCSLSPASFFLQWQWNNRHHRAKKGSSCQHVAQSGQRDEPVHTVTNMNSLQIFRMLKHYSGTQPSPYLHQSLTDSFKIQWFHLWHMPHSSTKVFDMLLMHNGFIQKLKATQKQT